VLDQPDVYAFEVASAREHLATWPRSKAIEIWRRAVTVRLDFDEGAADSMTPETHRWT
jgi:hypothetical protein